MKEKKTEHDIVITSDGIIAIPIHKFFDKLDSLESEGKEVFTDKGGCYVAFMSGINSLRKIYRRGYEKVSENMKNGIVGGKL